MTTRFSWYELMTLDTAAAKDFYGAVIGWQTQKWEAADYTMWTAAIGPVGGLMTLPEQAKAMGAPPHWMGYLSVANVADVATRATELGGRVYVPPTELPDGARFAVLADPTGASFGVHQSAPNAPAMAERGRGLGEFSWGELMTSDPAAAWRFYATLFGWVSSGSMDMGPETGSYDMFTTHEGANSIGGMMKLPPGVPVSNWLHYINVADVAATIAQVKERGGTVLYGPQEVPGGGQIAAFIDPQGAAFAVYAHVG